jgi:hypothetical protein
LESVHDSETLEGVLQQFGITEGVLFRIYRQTPAGEEFQYESATYSETFLQQNRGKGVYSVRIFINGKYKKTIVVLIGDPNPGDVKTSAAPGDSHTQFLEKLLMVMITNQQQHPTNNPTILDMTTALSNLDALRGKQESGMDMFKQGMEMARAMLDMSGSGDWKGELIKMGRDALPAITTVVQSQLNGRQPVPPVTPPNSEPTAEQPVIDPNKLTEQQKTDLLRQAITFLKGQFMGGLDPESVLNFISANSANPQYQLIILEILKLKSFEDIQKLDAELQQEPFLSSFRSVFDGLRSEFGAVDPVDYDSGGDVGNDGNVRTNGGAGTQRK